MKLFWKSQVSCPAPFQSHLETAGKGGTDRFSLLALISGGGLERSGILLIGDGFVRIGSNQKAGGGDGFAFA
jgi:hypothetical protein